MTTFATPCWPARTKFPSIARPCATRTSISAGAWGFGSQCIVVAIDPRRVDGKWVVHINGGRIPTDKEAVAWAKEVEDRGAGEILLTSMDKDGTKSGYDIEMTQAVAEAVSIPVIASGGAGCKRHSSGSA